MNDPAEPAAAIDVNALLLLPRAVRQRAQQRRSYRRRRGVRPAGPPHFTTIPICAANSVLLTSLTC